MAVAKAEFAERSCQCTSTWKLRWISCLLTSPVLLNLAFAIQFLKITKEKFSSWDSVSYQNIRTQSRKHFETGTIAERTDKATGRWVVSPDTYQGRYNGLWLRRPWEVSLVESVFSVAMESQVGKPMRRAVLKQWMGENLNLRIMWRVWIMLT